MTITPRWPTDIRQVDKADPFRNHLCRWSSGLTPTSYFDADQDQPDPNLCSDSLSDLEY